jgi:hypothetical protein
MTETPAEKKPIEEAEEENALFVVDSETYQQNKQLKQIYKAKEEYAKVHREAEGVDQRAFWSKIKALIMELEPLMKQMETNIDYLNDYHLTSIDLAAPELEIQWSEEVEELDYNSKEEAMQVAIQENRISKDYDVTGLSHLLQANVYPSYEQVERRAIRTEEGWKIDKMQFSSTRRFEEAAVHVLTGTTKKFDIEAFDKAYRGCRQFMSEAGLALKLEEDKGPARI